jgi:branched-chain amino acid transport system substrate-binding protein
MVSCELIKWRASRPRYATCKWVAVLCAVLGLCVCVAKAEDGVLSDRIVFGQPAALDGPASALGRGMRDGILAAFSEANRAGGIGGRKLELLSVDDGYDPVKSIEATRKLLDESRVFALIGPVGTPTSAAILPIATEHGAPFIGAFTGAEFLRGPDKTNVINLRASYFQETEEMVARLTADLNVTRIAILYQDDAYGRAGLLGVKRAMEKRQLDLVAEATYERNTTAVKYAMLTIRRAAPEAIIMIGAYAPCAEFVRLARQNKMDALFINISFVGSDALAKELVGTGANVVVTQVVPLPSGSSLPIVASYKAALEASNPDATQGVVSLEGYLVGRMTVMALRRIPGEISRANLIAAFRTSGSFDLEGFALQFGPTRNYGSDSVFLTVLQQDGTFKAVRVLTHRGTLP